MQSGLFLTVEVGKMAKWKEARSQELANRPLLNA